MRLSRVTDEATEQHIRLCGNHLGHGHHDLAYAMSVEYFEKNFDIARSVVSSGVGDNALVDASRVYLGMARGNKMLGKYMMKIQFDVNSLLKWKNKKDLSAMEE